MLIIAGTTVLLALTNGSAVAEQDSGKSASAAAPAPSYLRLPYYDGGTEVDNQSALVRRAKVRFALPPLYFRGAVWTCFRFYDGSGSAGSDATELNPNYDLCPTEFRELPTFPARYQNISLVGGTAFLFAVSTPGPRPTYGKLPAVRVHALAFGSIPVSATVHLEQTTTDGYLDPIKAEQSEINGVIPTGDPTWPGFPDAPPPVISSSGEPVDNRLVLRTTLRGGLNTRLSDVQIDGQPVDVGPRCQTVSPAQLRVDQPRGFFNTLIPPKRGQPSFFSPFRQPAGTFDGVVDIPAFNGCANGSENFDRILTNFISGTGNPVSGFVPNSVLFDYCQLPVANCTQAQRDGSERVAKLNAAIAAGESKAEIDKLRSAVKPSDYFRPKAR